MREGEELVLEPFKRLIEDDQLMAYKHEGFWRSMDTLRDRQILEDMVEQGDMPWRRPGWPRQAGTVPEARANESARRSRARASACRSCASARIPTTSRSARAAPSCSWIAAGVGSTSLVRAERRRRARRGGERLGDGLPGRRRVARHVELADVQGRLFSLPRGPSSRTGLEGLQAGASRRTSSSPIAATTPTRTTARSAS